MLNRPGAGGLIAALAAAGADKDGYTLYLTPAQTDDFNRSEERLWWPIVRQVNEQK